MESPGAEIDVVAEGKAPVRVKYVRTKHWGRWIAATVVIVAGLWLLSTIATNPHIKWDKVGEFIPENIILQGVWVTLQLTVLSMVFGIALGIVLALMRLSPNPVLRYTSGVYIWLFRGTPLLVQIILWFNIALIFPTLGIGPWTVDTNSVITTFIAAVLALSLNEGAYMCEIVRGGILSVGHGQMDAALSIGLTRTQSMRMIIIPQALRVIVPPTGNQAIGMLKATSLVSVIAARDLLTVSMNLYARSFLVIEMLFVASFWYLVLTTVATIGQYFLERKFSAGTQREAPVSMFAFMRSRLLKSSRASSALDEIENGRHD